MRLLLLFLLPLSITAQTSICEHYCQPPLSKYIFTPNGDGINDEWRLEIPDSTIIEGFSVQIYNGFDEQVFSSDTPYFSWPGPENPKREKFMVAVWIRTADDECSCTLELDILIK